MKGIWVPNFWLNQYRPEVLEPHRYFGRMHRFTEWVYWNLCKPLSRFTWFKILLPLISSPGSLSAQGMCHLAAQDLHYLDWINSLVWQMGSAFTPFMQTFAAAKKHFSIGICRTTKNHRRQENLYSLHDCFSLGYCCSQKEHWYRSNNSALVNPF